MGASHLHFVDRRAPEYGYENLGIDYGVRIVRWIEQNYAPAVEVEDDRAERNQLRFAVILRRATGGLERRSPGAKPTSYSTPAPPP